MRHELVGAITLENARNGKGTATKKAKAKSCQPNLTI
jgi:hypothetical protein